MVILAAALGPPGPASPPDRGKEPPGALHAVGLTPEVLKLMRAQVAVDQVADRIVAAARDDGKSGISGVVVDPGNHALTVYWHGQVNLEVSREILAGAAGGVRVAVVPAPYRLSELRGEAERLMALERSASGGSAHLVSVSPKPDGTGLDLGLSGLPAGTGAVGARQLVPYLATSRVAFTVSGDRPLTMDSRQDDWAPYWGGGVITQPDRACTTGWGMTANNSSATFILTAAHCGYGTWRDGGGEIMGDVVGIDWTDDGQVIATSAAGAIFDGDSIVGPNQFSKSVAGFSSNYVGDWVCTSGARTGAVCGTRIVRVFELRTYSGWQMVLNRAEQQDHIAPAGSGDSGGPVFGLTADASRVIARGTHTAHDHATNVACLGVPSGPRRTCGWRVFFPNITQQMAALNVHVTVG
jgi:hypothetical protein